MEYNITVTVERPAVDAEEAWADRVIDALAGYSPAIGWEPGRARIVVTVHALSLVAATSLATSDIQHATGLDPLCVEAMTTAEFDARSVELGAPA